MSAEALEQLTIAQRLYKDALEISDVQDNKLEAAIFRSFGNYYLRNKIYDRAMENFSECFEITNRMQDQPPSEIFQLLCDIGLCEFQQEYFKSAIESYHCAEAIFLKESGLFEKSEMFNVYKKIAEANSHKKIGNFQEAMTYFRLAEENVDDETSPSEKAHLFSNIASCQLNLSNIDQSIDYHFKAIQEYMNDDKKKHNLEISRCYFKIGFANIKVN